MDPLAVDLTLLLRTLEAEVRIAPGRVLTARVVDNQDPAKAKLSIAGKLLEARLPEHLKEGEEVRLTVREVSAEKVVLSLSTPPLAEAPRQGSARPDLSEEEVPEGRAGREASGESVRLRYQAPTIGPVDVRLSIHQGALRAIVAVRAGDVHGLAEGQAAELRERLAGITGMAVELVIQARRDPIEIYV